MSTSLSRWVQRLLEATDVLTDRVALASQRRELLAELERVLLCCVERLLGS